MPSNNNTINLTLSNPASGQASIFVNQVATLTLNLQNSTGSDIPLQAGASPSTFEIFMPSYFTTAEVENMQIALTGWSFQNNGQSLNLSYTGGGGSWTNGETISFQISNVLSDANPQTGILQVNLNNFSGTNIPIQVQSSLVLSNPPQPGNASLLDVLQVNLDNQGTVYISEPHDPIQNSLFLNIKNTGNTDLFNGNTMWTGTPMVSVTFIYGTTSGALAPDNDKSAPQNGSAWNIQGSIYADQTAGWQITNPSNTGVAPHPQWILNPSNTNQAILGTGSNSNVTFDFSQIVSQTPPGHTQATVQFTGFMKDDETAYDDCIFTLDIVKIQAPPTRGMVNFFGEFPLITVDEPNQPITFSLRWTMYSVSNVQLIVSYPGISAWMKTYPNPLPIAYDQKEITIPGVTNSGGLNFTIQAYNGNNGFLNSLQYSANILANFFYDTRDNKVYPVVQIGTKVWMAANLDYDAGEGCSFYAQNSSYEIPYGRLYTLEAAKDQIPDGWRLPTVDDWNDLISESGTTPQEAYLALVAPGTNGFEAQLGGFMDNHGTSNRLGVYGSYWSNTPEGSQGNFQYANFSENSKTATTGASSPSDYFYSVRYVKDVL